jgi:hypothetical protein
MYKLFSCSLSLPIAKLIEGAFSVGDLRTGMIGIQIYVAHAGHGGGHAAQRRTLHGRGGTFEKSYLSRLSPSLLQVLVILGTCRFV